MIDMKLSAFLREDIDELLHWLRQLDRALDVGEAAASRNTPNGDTAVTVKGVRVRKDSREHRPWADILADMENSAAAAHELSVTPLAVDDDAAWEAWEAAVLANRRRKLALLQEAAAAAPAGLFAYVCSVAAGGQQASIDHWIKLCEESKQRRHDQLAAARALGSGM